VTLELSELPEPAISLIESDNGRAAIFRLDFRQGYFVYFPNVSNDGENIIPLFN
jgi:hypothetical protein